MDTERAIINVMNTIGPASAPFNGFAAYRARKFPHEKHVILSLESVDESFLRALAAQGWNGNLTIIDCKGSVLRLAKLSRQLFRELRAKYPRLLVHLHHHRSGLLFHLVRPLLGGQTPVLFTIRNSFADYSLPGKLLAASNFLLARAVTFVGSATYHAFPLTLRRLRGSVAIAVPNGADVERIDGVLRRLTVQHSHTPASARSGPSDAGERSEIHPPPMSPSLKLLYVARFVKQKNHAFLIQLLAALPAEVTLILVGDGVLRRQVWSMARDAGVTDRVRFTGLISREAVYEEMGHADVFVSSSRWEGLPVAALEAMATRLPLVLSDIEPHQEIAAVAPLVKLLPLRLELWGDLLRTWASLPRQELRRIGECNREAVVAELSLNRMHERYTEIYQRMAGWSAYGVTDEQRACGQRGR
jgi:glycosyltransferase involved in cell wall biosynthesis